MALPARKGLGEYCGSSIRRRRTSRLVITENEFEPGLEIGLHEHAFCHFTAILSGGFTETYSHQELHCPAGSVLIVPSRQPHQDTIWTSGAHTLSVEISRSLQASLDEGLSILRKPRVFSEPSLLRRVESLHGEFRSFDPASLFAIEALALEILVSVARLEPPGRSKKSAWLPLVMEEIHRDPYQPISLRKLAQSAGVHETHLARTFRRAHGCTVGEYMRWLRLEAAKDMLADSGAALADIAVRCGFYDQAHFSRAFKNAYGVSPAAYRSSRTAR